MIWVYFLHHFQRVISLSVSLIITRTTCKSGHSQYLYVRIRVEIFLPSFLYSVIVSCNWGHFFRCRYGDTFSTAESHLQWVGSHAQLGPHSGGFFPSAGPLVTHSRAFESLLPLPLFVGPICRTTWEKDARAPSTPPATCSATTAAGWQARL